MNKCLIRESLEIRTAINDRINKRDLFARDIIRSAKEKGLKFSESQLSRYRKHGHINSGLSSSEVLWICGFLNIELKLNVRKRRVNKKK